ncbi:MAG: hypothetical protein LUF29_04685 [Oscillospiraceae bacterium]|nr:hypothetical protein [Oscillospiraceae bacterium]
MKERIRISKYFSKIRRMRSGFQSRYKTLCLDGCKTDDEIFFADNYRIINDSIGYLLSCNPKAELTAGLELAEYLLSHFDGKIPSTDEIILLIRDYATDSIINPCDIENLKFELTYLILEQIDEDLHMSILMLSGIDSIDEYRINETVNPVAIELSRDEYYPKCDRKTRKQYREQVYSSKPILFLNRCPKSRIATDLTVELLEVAIAFMFTLALTFQIGEPWTTLFLICPAYAAIKAVVNDILLRHVPRIRLPRLDMNSEEVRNTPCAVVLSAVVTNTTDADSLYSKLLKLHATNPQPNISVCLLADFSASHAPVTGDDKAIADSLCEMTDSLNRENGNIFSCIIRKRTYSETQDEFMGYERKRGAIVDLARFMKTGEHDFYSMSGSYERLVGTEYIVCVDSDTEPYMNSVAELLSIALHPANSGYGIISPRMVTRLGDSLATGFSRAMGGIGSISGYDLESMDFWQDVYGRGTFCGKGLLKISSLLERTGFLPHEKVLSHDILEGELVNTAYAHDVIFTEGFPKNPVSYFKRLDRWIRGDIQNLRFIFSGKFDLLSKLKLWENLRRSFLPIDVFATLLLGLFLYPEASGKIALAAVIMYLIPQFLGLIGTLLNQGIGSRRFYSAMVSGAALNISSLVYALILLPTLALKSARAMLTAIFRMMTGRNLLEWTVSSTYDGASTDGFSFFFPSWILGTVLVFSSSYIVRFFGILFALLPVLLSFGTRKTGISQRNLSERNRRELSSQVADMWCFFEEYVNESENCLPPDNVQFSPVYRIAHRTSPTNIGMYLVSVLAACDRRLISPENMYKRINGTLDSIERMEKYSGNLYNWYDTKTLKLCPNPYVSSVDSGNFICSLVALKEGLKEYTARCPELSETVARIEKIIADCDLSIFFDDVRGLMAIGINPETGKPDSSRYDFLMSEARLGSFYSIASHQVPKSHWYSLSRLSLSCGFYAGTASFSGTMFEYFMPELFLESPEGSLLNESLRYALWCQKRYAKSFGRPYGISESGYYSFDSSLSYRYMAHGVPKTGLRRGLEQDFVLSPYSTYLSLGYSGDSGMENLNRLKKYGMYSRYGFYEALDFTVPDPPDGYAVVKSYMSHHVGMSIISAVNVLEDGIFQRRFMRDKNVMGAIELLDERVRLERNIYEDTVLKPKYQKTEEVISPTSEYFASFSPFNPRVKLLRNSDYTLALTDGGTSIAIYRGRNVYSRTHDLVNRPKGAFFGVISGDERANFAGDACEFGDGFAVYRNTIGKINAEMRVSLHRTFPCELRTFSFKNNSQTEKEFFLCAYIEPSLMMDESEQAHPAYSKMFLRLDVDPNLNIITATRSDCDTSDKPYMAVGFIDNTLGLVSFDREDVLSRPEGAVGFLERADKVTSSLISEPDPCIFVKTPLKLPPSGEANLNMFILTADSYDELINMTGELKAGRIEECLGYSSAPSRLLEILSGNVLLAPCNSPERRDAVLANTLPLSSLWELSISTDLPLILYSFDSISDTDRLSVYIRAFRDLRLSGIKAQMAVLFDDAGRYEREHYTALVRATRELSCEGLLYSGGGIYPVDRSSVREELVTLLKAYAFHISHGEIEAGMLSTPFSEIEIKPVMPSKQHVDEEIACGGFCRGKYVINEKSPLPWCHVLSSRQFGTLLSEGSLGFTYAHNSRELRLTPWDNDTSRDNIGERLILHIGDEYFDLIRGSAAVFAPYLAEYHFEEKHFRGCVIVGVSEKGMCKRIRVNISVDQPAELSYYTEPCLGLDRSKSHLLKPERKGNTLLISNCASPVTGFMAITSSIECRFQTDGEEFLSGNWRENITVGEDTIAAGTVELQGKTVVDFYMSYAHTEKAAILMPEYFRTQTDTREHKLTIKTQEIGLRILSDDWLRYQALHARIWARTGFYQSSGAYGFRDQLQDAVGIILENPHECRVQIVRAAGAQFIEGDVMHWWHELPLKKTTGIRTRISDDPLWLVYAVCEYIEKTGDSSILDVQVAYSAGITLTDDERDSCGEVYRTSLRESIYSHCVRAIEYVGSRTGKHGLMLIGTGDWNDGFSSLGEKGTGESVWLSEFYVLVLKRFSEICKTDYRETLLERAKSLESAISASGKSDKWYLRAYSDSGTVLGDESSASCKLDSISQSFAQFAELPDTEFAKSALLEAYSRLAEVDNGVIRLFYPPFPDESRGEVGYIASYPDGIRENGGQYTHAAIWLGMACIEAGLTDEGLNILKALNPILRSQNCGYTRYKTEPYYICGDVYSNKNCYARGGWSIYTGSAAWYYRAIIEDILGLRLKYGKLTRGKSLVDARLYLDGREVTE